MRYLVVGAGVLGGYLAHELYRGQKDVTMLVTERRYKEIKQKGLVIQHIRQKNKTVDQIPVISQIQSTDCYDVIIVVVQKSQLAEVLENISQNKCMKTVILIGNNCEASRTYHDFIKKCDASLEVLFGFLSCGGRRENGIIYNWHGDVCNLTLGPVAKSKPMQFDDNELQKDNGLHINRMPDMDAWLKYHAAVITPICIAIEIEKGNTKGLLHSKALRVSIDAVKECMQFYKQQGVYLDPSEELKFLQWPTWLIHLILALF